MAAADVNESPYSFFKPVTPADGTDLASGPCRALYVGVTGDVTVDDAFGNTSVLFKAVPVGVLKVQLKRVRATGTTATNLVALY